VSVTRVGEIEDPYLDLAGEPLQLGRRGEQIGGVSRSGILAAMPAMAEIEVLEVSCDFKADGAAEARTGMFGAHGFEMYPPILALAWVPLLISYFVLLFT
jgi:hypothetical protein